MKPVAGIRSLVLAACLLGAASGVHAGPLPLLSIIDLGQATGLTALRVTDINNQGDVLMRRDADGRAFIWNPVGGLVIVDVPGASLYPFALNDAREVVGLFASPEGLDGFRWDSTRGFRQPRHRGFEHDALTAINSQGEVVGSGHTLSDRYHMVVGGAKGGLHAVRKHEKGQSQAAAINDAGSIGGWVSVQDGCCEAAALIDPDGQLTLLGTLGAPGEKDHSSVYAVNAAGAAVGQSGDHQYRGHAFHWSAASGLRDIHPLSQAHSWSAATGVNRWGQVIATANHGDTSFAFSWDPENGSADLNARLDPSDPLHAVTQVMGWGAPRINDQGQIVAEALVRGVRTVVLLSPIAP